MVIKMHKCKLLAGVLLVALVWLSWPVYQFFAHRGHIPLVPYGFLTIPLENPTHQTLADPAYRAVGDRALQALAEHRRKVKAPGISAAVAIEGRTVWTGSSGWADIASRRPVTTETRFRVGSTSKVLTATALARLVQSGQIDLDTSIDHYMDKLPRKEWAQLTPRHLASHMAGLPEYKENRDWLGVYHTLALRRHYDNVYDALDVFDRTPLLYPPGSQYHYSSFNTVLLSAVMAASQDQPYLDLMREAVFEPLGMTATGPEPRGDDSFLATFYWRDGDKVRPWRPVDLSHRLAGGGFVSTPIDLVRLGSAWLDESFIKPETQALFWQPQKNSQGEINPERYALGWRIHGGGDGDMPFNANHGGVSRGSQSWLMVIPEHQMVLAVAINSGTDEFWDFAKISHTLVKIFGTRDS